MSVQLMPQSIIADTAQAAVAAAVKAAV